MILSINTNTGRPQQQKFDTGTLGQTPALLAQFLKISPRGTRTISQVPKTLPKDPNQALIDHTKHLGQIPTFIYLYQHTQIKAGRLLNPFIHTLGETSKQ